ncbi:hypothetical protein [Gramella sp. KN1008]|uniref:hypothetical protein n=1 Tax=Gramella sp. KN1008 TaxID=2529298 RepID=UPI0010406A2D|nr:hypothetical protein [Gramella sp. KN1008]TBW26965.1 hypothetical protein EZJ28_11640 [Gramella sp. KN1008]
MTNRDGNVAFKVTYTDSEWSGVCSPELAALNFKRQTYCREQSQNKYNCQHSKYSDPAKFELNGFPCFDSVAQLGLLFYAGHYHSAEKSNLPKTANYIKKNKIAVFTSIKPFAEEQERFIFAIGRINEIEILDDSNGSYPVYLCDQDSAIIFKNNRPLFWKYYTNENNPTEANWRSLLFRYLEDDLVEEILNDIAHTHRYPGKYRKKARGLLAHLKEMNES